MRTGIVMLILFLSCKCLSQNNYYISDTSLTIVDNLVDKGSIENCRICTIRYKKKTEQFLPTQIKEYGFKNGITYVSRDIKISDSLQRVFLERVINGKVKLYFFKNKKIKLYLIEHGDGSFIEMNSSDFRSTLSKVSSGHKYLSDKISQVHYNRFSLANFVSQLNDGADQYFPSFKFGVAFSTGFQTLGGFSKVNIFALSQASSKYKIYSSVGMFLEFPLIRNKVSLNTGFLFSKNSFAYSAKINDLDADYILNTASVLTPFFIRYSFRNKGGRPFIATGITYAYHIKDENSTFSAINYPDHIELNSVDRTNYYFKHQLGFGAGGGKEFKLDNRHHLTAELRLNEYVGLSKANSLKKSEIILLLGINF